jgi:hypothetical protein
MPSIFKSSGAAAGPGVVGAFAACGTTAGAGAGVAATLAAAGGLGDGLGDGLGGAAGMLGGALVDGLVTAFSSGVAAGAGAGADAGASGTTATTVVAAGGTIGTGSGFCACFTPQQPAAKTHAKATTGRFANNVAARSIIGLSGSGTTDRTFVQE